MTEFLDFWSKRMGLNVYLLFPILPAAIKPNAQLVFYVLRRRLEKYAVQIKYLREVTLEEKILVYID